MHPLRRGFDSFYGFLGGAHSYFKSEKSIVRGTEPVGEMTYTTDDFGKEACDFVDRHRDQPWFLYLAFNAVHTPMEATEDRLAKFQSTENRTRRTYNAMMLAMDEAIGKVIARLESSGQRDRTLITFISDNGGPTMPGVTVNGSNNHPLRGSKRTTLEGGIRVPYLVSWKDKLKPSTFDAPVIQLDLTATALAAAQVPMNDDDAKKIDGVDLLPYLQGIKTGEPHEALFWRFGSQMAIRAGDWKLVRYDLNADSLTGKSNQGVTEPKLFHLGKDIGESKDLASEMPDQVKRLQSLWERWNTANVEPLWGSSGEGKGEGKKANRNARRRRCLVSRAFSKPISRACAIACG